MKKESTITIIINEAGQEPRTLHLEMSKAYRVGREGDIVIRDVRCSRIHVAIKATRRGTLEFLDLNSKNGIRAHGESAKAGELSRGEFLELGRSKIVFTHSAPSYPAVTQGDAIERSDFVR